MRILLVGDYPPPYGGIAVHLQHLTRTLPQEGVHSRVLNIGPNRRMPSPEYESVRGPADFVRHLKPGQLFGESLQVRGDEIVPPRHEREVAVAAVMAAEGDVDVGGTRLTPTQSRGRATQCVRG